uniref:RNA helicase n=1 Tax=Zooxanthella nutricula TaxID=1333877 RepID=A0A7S2J2E7_9DINO
MADTVRVWDNSDKEVTGEIEPWSTWEQVKAVKGFPGGLIAFLQTSTDSEGCGFHQPTIVQAYAWPVLQTGKDLVGVAKTGSGKTLAFLLPGFIKLRKLKKQGVCDTSKGPALLCMTPTRELCHQIWSDAEKFGKPVQITAACAYGGAPKRDQEWKIKEGPDCLIATPGRLNDFCDSGVVRLDQVKFVVLDEADRMLDMGFDPQIKQVLDRCPWEKQMSMFTATWPRECRDLAKKYINDPMQIQIGTDDITTNQNITQHVKICDSNDAKKQALKEILGNLQSGGNCLVFSNTKKNCRDLAWELNDDKSLGLWTEEIHGDLDQGKRDQALNRFRSGEARVLCATDVAARGLDIRNITVVVNYDCPKNAEDYVHRIGRTGRAEDMGEAYTFLGSWGSDKEAGFITDIMKKAGQEPPEELRKITGGGGGGSSDWGKKDDSDWWKKDEEKKEDDWWKKDEKKEDEWWKKDEAKDDSSWNKDSKDEWKSDDWKGSSWDDKNAEDTADDGGKRKALWGLLDEPAAKGAKTE